jgi:hypothetical protein
MKIILILWQLPQFISGLIFKNIHKNKITRVEKYKTSTVHFLKGLKEFGVSFGIYIFISDDERGIELIPHEFGHSIQSEIFGWTFLAAVGIVSVLRFKKFTKNEKFTKSREEKIALWKKYYSFYPENWANKLGGADIDKWIFFKNKE